MSNQTHPNGVSAIYPELRDRRVIITGGATGIGAGLIEAFASQGARVVFVDIQDDAGEALAQGLADARHAPAYRHLDLSDADAISNMFEGFVQELGGIDVLLNNAASDNRHAISDVTPAFWEERMNVNLRHQFFASQAVTPAMREGGGGAIINFGSISWHLALPDLVLYQTAKAAVSGLTRSLARELGRDNIRVNTIVPGNVKTPRQDMWYSPEDEAEIVAAQCLPGRITPHDVAALALFLSSDGARMCTGHDYWIDAGWR